MAEMNSMADQYRQVVDQSITGLRTITKGRVITPDDAEYQAARTIFYGGINSQPGAIVRAVDAHDVASVVSFAHDSGLELAIRSGGHSLAGHCLSDGGIVLDLKEMRGLQIDAENRTAWAETGLTSGEYTAAAGAYGLATGFGDTPTVGIGGLTLGGGVGYLVRKYGLTIDNLLAAEIVTADGRLLHTDASSHPDLFWAIRGGGGNFGVVTRLQFRLRPVDTVVGGLIILPATPEVIASFIAEAEAAPDELSTILNVMPAPPMPFIPAAQHGRLIALATMVYAGPVEAGQQAVARFRALAQPIVDMLRPMHYPEIFPREEGEYHPEAVSHTMFLDRVDGGVAETMLRYLASSDAVMRAVQLRVLGGAAARVPAEATAFAHRQARIMTNLAAFYNGPEDRAVRALWVADFADALDQGVAGAYVNFLEDEGKGEVQTAYPQPTRDRLAAIKARYDPTNLFHRNHNIRPVG